MSRRRPLLGGVPRVGSPASSLVLRRSDFSSPRSRSFPSRGRSGALLRRRRDLPGSWATLAHVPRFSDPGGPARGGPGHDALRFRDTGVAFRSDDGVGHHDCSFRGSISRPMRPLSTLRTAVADGPRKTRFCLPTSGLGSRDFHPQAALRNFRSLSPSFPARLFLAHLPQDPWALESDRATLRRAVGDRRG